MMILDTPGLFPRVVLTLLFGVSGTMAYGQSGALPPIFPLDQSARSVDGGGYRTAPAWWLGGDVAAPARLGPGKTFWTFSDTFISPDPPARRPEGVVSNSIAITTFRNGVFTPTYYYRGTPENPRPFFEDPAAPAHKTRFWTTSNLMHGGKLFVFLSRRYDDPDPAIEDRPVTSVIARIQNPQDDPSLWQIDHLTLCATGDPIFGVANLVLGEMLYSYGFFVKHPGGGRAIVIRVPLSVLHTAGPDGDLSKHAEYLAGDETWKPGLSGPDCWDVGIGAVSGFTVRWNPGLRRWQAVGIMTSIHASDEPLHARSAQVLLSAHGPFGPWENRADIYRFPEIDPQSPSYRPGAMCYGVREQPDFSSDPDHKILLTYTYGPRQPVGWLFTDLQSYRVKAIEVDNPFVLAPNAD